MESLVYVKATRKPSRRLHRSPSCVNISWLIFTCIRDKGEWRPALVWENQEGAWTSRGGGVIQPLTHDTHAD